MKEIISKLVNWTLERGLLMWCITLLMLASFFILPYYQYQILRISVCGTAGYLAYKCFEQECIKSGYFLIPITILFNPIFPFHLARSSWQFIDFTVGIIFIVILFTPIAKFIEHY
jgi:hypothetical protein